jgi:hypothetical protein
MEEGRRWKIRKHERKRERKDVELIILSGIRSKIINPLS